MPCLLLPLEKWIFCLAVDRRDIVSAHAGNTKLGRGKGILTFFIYVGLLVYVLSYLLWCWLKSHVTLLDWLIGWLFDSIKTSDKITEAYVCTTTRYSVSIQDKKCVLYSVTLSSDFFSSLLSFCPFRDRGIIWKEKKKECNDNNGIKIFVNQYNMLLKKKPVNIHKKVLTFFVRKMRKKSINKNNSMDHTILPKAFCLLYTYKL